MSRDLMNQKYYVSHGGMIPVKWTAPEVGKIGNIYCQHVCITHRLCTIRSIQQLVMCGAMEFSCMRYGVWDTSHLKMKKI